MVSPVVRTQNGSERRHERHLGTDASPLLTYMCCSVKITFATEWPVGRPTATPHRRHDGIVEDQVVRRLVHVTVLSDQAQPGDLE